MGKKLSAVIGVASILFGCATQPEDIQSTYVSPLTYRNYDCDQIALEMDNVSHRTSELYTQLNNKANNVAAQMGVGLVLFWPALFFLEGGDGPEATEYSRLKGEYGALQKNAVQKKCALNTLPPSPQEIIEQKKQEEAKKAEEASMEDDSSQM